MSYEPTNWKAGDTVTSAKLNKLEQGVASSGSGVLMLHMNQKTGALDKTWKEIEEAMQEKIVCICMSSPEGISHGFVQYVFTDSSIYTVPAFIVMPNGSINNVSFVTNSEDGYPAIEMPPVDNDEPRPVKVEPK